jgi:hypothetical protein
MIPILFSCLMMMAAVPADKHAGEDKRYAENSKLTAISLPKREKKGKLQPTRQNSFEIERAIVFHKAPKKTDSPINSKVITHS